MRVFISHSSRDKELASAIANQLRANGHEVKELRSAGLSGDALTHIFSSIRSSDVVIAILTAENPNVLYELGLAHGTGKTVLLVAPTTDQIPFSIAAVPYVQLSGEILRDSKTIALKLSEMEIKTQPRLPRVDSPHHALELAIKDPDYIEFLTPKEFEALVAEVYQGFGYEVSATPRTRDGGIDLIATQWLTGIGRTNLIVQVKNYNRHSHVPVEAVRQLAYAVEANEFGANAGVLVSASGFTAAAREFCRSTPNVFLHTIEDLLSMLKKHHQHQNMQDRPT
jgi:restriction endonuclease/TIR domain-containing protein